MKEVLFKLNEFCKANRIEYAVTGTTALSLLGVPSRFLPQDIDIKVFHLTGEQAKKLEELQFLSGFKSDDYGNSQCFSFIVDGVKINAIIDKTKDYDEICGQNVCINYIDEERKKHHLISVQLVNLALADKMKLNRNKDKAYLIDLINNLTSLI